MGEVVPWNFAFKRDEQQRCGVVNGTVGVERTMTKWRCGHTTRANCKKCKRCFACCVENKCLHPSKEDCRVLDAAAKAAKQIHAEFDCLSDHVQTKREIEAQIAHIIWKYFDPTKFGMRNRP